MKTLHLMLFMTAMSLFIWGFASIDNHGSKTKSTYSGGEPIPSVTPQTAIYTDNFDGANDTTSLKARGYKVYRRGGPPGTAAIWFQGNPTVFSAFNGPSSGYVASNFQTTSGANPIDNWLVLPWQSGGYMANDSIRFYSRSPLGSIWPDSIRVMYSLSDSVPEGTWIELGRFQVNTIGIWELRGFRVPTTSANGRLAIRYAVVDGGPSGNNSDYIGIDALVVWRGTVGISPINNEVPASYQLEQNYPNPFNPETRIKFSLPKDEHVKLVIYDALGNQVDVLVDAQVPAGTYMADFDASKLSSGIYFYTLSTQGYRETKKMMLIK